MRHCRTSSAVSLYQRRCLLERALFADTYCPAACARKRRCETPGILHRCKKESLGRGTQPHVPCKTRFGVPEKNVDVQGGPRRLGDCTGRSQFVCHRPDARSCRMHRQNAACRGIGSRRNSADSDGNWQRNTRAHSRTILFRATSPACIFHTPSCVAVRAGGSENPSWPVPGPRSAPRRCGFVQGSGGNRNA